MTTQRQITLKEYQIAQEIYEVKIKPFKERLNQLTQRQMRLQNGILADTEEMNGSKKHIGLFDEEKKETKIELFVLDDLFKHSNKLKATVLNYDNNKHTDNNEL